MAFFLVIIPVLAYDVYSPNEYKYSKDGDKLLFVVDFFLIELLEKVNLYFVLEETHFVAFLENIIGFSCCLSPDRFLFDKGGKVGLCHRGRLDAAHLFSYDYVFSVGTCAS